MALTLGDVRDAYYQAPYVARQSSLPAAEQRFVDTVLGAAAKLPFRGVLLFDYDQTLASANVELREGAAELIERLKQERPDLKLGVLTTRREGRMGPVRRDAKTLGLTGPIYQHEHADAVSRSPDLAELAEMAQMTVPEVRKLLGTIVTQNKLHFLVEAFEGKLRSVHLIDDGDCGTVGQKLGLATHVEAPISSVRDVG
jgi:hypothetical protein